MTSKNKVDRRIVRTRAALSNALLSLITERGYEEITITDIAERADIRRATFYLHYNDLDSLLFATLQKLFDDFVATLQEQDRLKPFYTTQTEPHILPMLSYIADHARLYQQLITGRAGIIVQRFVRNYLAKIKQQDLEAHPHPERHTLPITALAHMMAAAETGILVWWLENDLPYPPEEMAEMMESFLMLGAQACID